MLLLIDIGNTQTVFAVYQARELVSIWRLESNPRATGDFYASFLTPLFNAEGLEFSEVSECLISSVVPDVNFEIGQFIKKYCGIDPVFVSAEIKGITIAIDNPAEVGADRLVNAAGFLAHYEPPGIVIDFGTATTFDVILPDKIYAGGVIAPGIPLSMEALTRAAAKLPKVAIQKPESVIGKSTVHAMQSGIYFGYCGLIARIISGIADEISEKPFVVATGGLGHLFGENMDEIDEVDPELTLKGLLHVHQGGLK